MNTFTAAVIEDDIERAVALATDQPIGADPYATNEDDEHKRKITMSFYFSNRRRNHHDEAAT